MSLGRVARRQRCANSVRVALSISQVQSRASAVLVCTPPDLLHDGSAASEARSPKFRHPPPLAARWQPLPDEPS